MAITTVSQHVVSVNAIQGTLIADNAITAVHIATNAVSGTLIADNAITATHIAQNTITVTQLADDAVEAAKIADGVITTNHLNKAMISSQTEVTAATGDFLLLGDTSDSNNLKKVPVSSILAGTLTTAAQTNITSVGTLTGLAVSGTPVTLTSTSATDNLLITSTDANASTPGPDLVLYRNSSSPADGDDIGHIQFRARNDNSQDFEAVNIHTWSGDVSDGAEDAAFGIYRIMGGASKAILYADSGALTFNHQNADVDFIVETVNRADCFKVDAALDAVYINESSSTAYASTGEPVGLLTLHNKNGSDGSGVNNYTSLEFNTADGATSQGFINYVRTGDNLGNFTFSARRSSSHYDEIMRLGFWNGPTYAGMAVGSTTLGPANGSIGPTIKISSDQAGTDVGIVLEADTGEYTLYSYNDEFKILKTDAAFSERMRIHSNGWWRFTSATFYQQLQLDDSSGTEGYVYAEAGELGFLDADGHWTYKATNGADHRWYVDNSTKGILNSSGVLTVTSVTETSDYRLKDGISNMNDGALARVNALTPRKFTWKEDGRADEGFIAHELNAVEPNLVFGEKDGTEEVSIKGEEGGKETVPSYQSVEYAKLTTLLVKAVQELSAEVEKLKG